MVSPNDANVTFESENPLIAYVAADGSVTGNIAGEVLIKVSLNGVSDKCKVKVNTTKTMYNEPYLGFGAAATKIKSFEKRSLLSETSEGIIYSGENSKIKYAVYALENSKLKVSAVYIPYSSANAELLGAFISERYVTSVGSDIVFISPDRKIGGGITPEIFNGAYYYMVFYFDYVTSSPNSLKSKSDSNSGVISDEEREFLLKELNEYKNRN